MELTPREQEILGYIARGLSNKNMSVVMDISEDTVRYHANNLLTKLDAGTRAEAVWIAVVEGYLVVP